MVASAAIVAAGCAGHGADGARSIRFIRLNTWAYNLEAIRFNSPAYNFEAKPNASETDALAAVASAAIVAGRGHGAVAFTPGHKIHKIEYVGV